MIGLENFNLPNTRPFGLGMGKMEFEETAVFLLIQHLKNQLPFDQPIQCDFDHSDMVQAGWLEEKGEKLYILTEKSIGLLYGMYGK